MTRPFALALLLSVSTAASADAGLDLALVIDRSTSMARHSRNVPLLLRMTLDLVARNAAANRVEHRLCVIGFGSSAKIDLPLTPVRPGDLPTLRRRVDALRYEDRGETDVLAAFVAAEKLFRALPANAERRRAIVLLTDGVPYIRGADMDAYGIELRRFATTRLHSSGITVDVLLLDPRFKATWQQVARGVELVGRAPDQLLAPAHAVIARLVGTRTVESAPAKTNPAIDTLVVPPYLDVVVFDIVRTTPDTAVDVFPPGSATPIQAGANGIESVRLGDVLATLVVPRPPPGEWIIRKSRADAHVRILSQQFFPRGILLRPAKTEALRQCDRVPIAYRVLDGHGRPLEELRGYALALEVTLAKPGGTSSVIAMEPAPDLGAAIYRSTRDVLCELAGRYWTDVRITTVDASGRRLDVFRDRWSGFSVAAHPCHGGEEPPMVPTVARTAHIPSAIAWIPLLIGASVIAAFLWYRKTKS